MRENWDAWVLLAGAVLTLAACAADEGLDRCDAGHDATSELAAVPELREAKEIPAPQSPIPWQRLIGAAATAGKLARRPWELDSGTSEDLDMVPTPVLAAPVGGGPDPGPVLAGAEVGFETVAASPEAGVCEAELRALPLPEPIAPEYLPLVAGAAVLQASLDPAHSVGDGKFRDARPDTATQSLFVARQGLKGAVGGQWRALEHEVLQLYAGAWPVCTAKVERLALQVAFQWLGESGLPGPYDGAPDTVRGATLARAVWHHDLAHPMLVAELRPVHGDCRGATWARSTRLPAPPIAAAMPAPRDWRDRGVYLLHKLPEWKAIQREYEASGARTSAARHWDRYQGEEPFITLIRGRDEAWLHVRAAVGESCGDAFADGLEALWRLTGEIDDPSRAKAVLRGVRPAWHTWPEMTLLGGADTDGDGELELLRDDGHVRGRLEAEERVEVPEEFTCPC
jgi:hypothetical protein